jgi:Na+/alanine symporter
MLYNLEEAYIKFKHTQILQVTLQNFLNYWKDQSVVFYPVLMAYTSHVCVCVYTIHQNMKFIMQVTGGLEWRI